MEKEKLKSLLDGCLGTEHYFVCPPFRTIYTDGVKLFAENANAYWFLCDLFILINEKGWQNQAFMQITLNVKNDSADLVIDDGNDNLIYNKHYDYTDCPSGEWRFFYLRDVLMLPSEY